MVVAVCATHCVCHTVCVPHNVCSAQCVPRCVCHTMCVPRCVCSTLCVPQCVCQDVCATRCVCHTACVPQDVCSMMCVPRCVCRTMCAPHTVCHTLPPHCAGSWWVGPSTACWKTARLHNPRAALGLAHQAPACHAATGRQGCIFFPGRTAYDHTSGLEHAVPSFLPSADPRHRPASRRQGQRGKPDFRWS